MKRGTYSIRLLLIVIALFVTSLAVSSSSASAASSYDDLIEPVSNVFVGHNGPCEGPFDLTANWPSYVTNDQLDYGGGSTARSNFRASLATALSTGTGWAVSQTRYGDAGHVNVFVHADGYPTSVTSFYTISGYQLVLMSNVYGLQISYSSFGPGDCRVYMDYNTSEAANSREIAFDQQGIYTRQPLFANTPITYPAGYEGKLFPTEPPAAKYVAMGDSFSSGEGNEPFEAGTDTSSNTCHRSSLAWPRKLQFDSSLDLGPTAFVACSGAVSDYIINSYNQENVELPQAVYISQETELVTITIGGNDIGFGNVLVTCTMATEEEGTTEEKHQIEHDACINAIDDARGIATGATFQDDLETVFSGLRDLGNENLQVVVVGYPNLLPAYRDIVGSCIWGNGYLRTSGRNVASDEVQKSRLLHDELNEALENAVDATNDSNIHFVDPSSVFIGHELCRPMPWFNSVVPDAFDEVRRRMSYHPNNGGQIAYADAVETEVNNLLE